MKLTIILLFIATVGCKNKKENNQLAALENNPDTVFVTGDFINTDTLKVAYINESEKTITLHGKLNGEWVTVDWDTTGKITVKKNH